MKNINIIFLFLISLSIANSEEYLEISYSSKSISRNWNITFDDSGYIINYEYTDSAGENDIYHGKIVENTYQIFDNNSTIPYVYYEKNSNGYKIYDKNHKIIKSINNIKNSIPLDSNFPGEIIISQNQYISKDTAHNINYIYPLNNGLQRLFTSKEYNLEDYTGCTEYIKKTKNTFIISTTVDAPGKPDYYYIKTNHKFHSVYTVITYLDFIYPINHFVLPFIIGLPPEEKNDYSDKNAYYSDSFLIEANNFYYPSNLRKGDGLPWASNNKNGIGDKILISTGSSPAKQLSIINGYQSSEKKYLYNQNSRIKTAKLTNVITKRSIIINVKDSMELQTFNIYDLASEYKPDSLFLFEVLSVYPGSKYNDLCIQMMRLD